jgi:chromate transport protein ChrA
MFEQVGTILNEFNILGVGIYLAVIGLIFAISLGIGKREKEQVLLWSIALGSFGTLLLFRDDYIKAFLFLTTAFIIILYGLTKLGVSPKERE